MEYFMSKKDELRYVLLAMVWIYSHEMDFNTSYKINYKYGQLDSYSLRLLVSKRPTVATDYHARLKNEIFMLIAPIIWQFQTTNQIAHGIKL